MEKYGSNILSIGHRGGGGDQRENTLDAFLYAVTQGCKAIEMDLRFDYMRKHFYLEHSFLHGSEIKNNTLDKIIPKLPNELMLVIEFKSNAVISNTYVEHFAEAYRKYFMGRKIVIISYNPVILHKMKKILPDIERGYLCGNHFSFFLFRTYFRKYVDPSFLFIHKRMLNSGIIKYAGKQRYKTIAYVLNTERAWTRALQKGINGIITDNPRSFSEFLKR
jgi:glycerophosphoryl diester phosphodiesterase